MESGKQNSELPHPLRDERTDDPTLFHSLGSLLPWTLLLHEVTKKNYRSFLTKPADFSGSGWVAGCPHISLTASTDISSFPGAANPGFLSVELQQNFFHSLANGLVGHGSGAGGKMERGLIF